MTEAAIQVCQLWHFETGQDDLCVNFGCGFKRSTFYLEVGDFFD